MRSNILGFSTLAMAAGALGCQIGGSAGLTGTTSPNNPPPPPPPGPAEPMEPAGAGAAGAVEASPDCPNPADHCLPDGTYLISDRDFGSRYRHIYPAKPQTQVDGGGEATFFNLSNSKDQTTKWHYATRPATEADLVVGRHVFYINKRDGKLYRPAETRQEATATTWLNAKIISLAPTQTNGYVLTTQGRKVRVDALRVSDQLPAPDINVDLVSGEDVHFLTPNHYLHADRALKGRYIHVYAAAPIKQPTAATKGDGHFVSLSNGKVSWTRHNWRTRPATNADLKVGKQVFFLNKREGKTYRPPKDRGEALHGGWLSAKITDTSQLYKGMVTAGNGRLVPVSAIRVEI